MSQRKSTGSNYTCQLYFDPRADEPDTGGHCITDKEIYIKLLNLTDGHGTDMEEEIQHPSREEKIDELINYIWKKDCLNDVYHVRDANCQK